MPPLQLPTWVAALADAAEWGRDTAALAEARSRGRQSAKGAVARLGDDAFGAALDALRPAVDRPRPLLPTVHDVRAHLLPPSLAERCGAELTMIHLGFGRPVVDPASLTLSLVFHLRQRDRRLKVKVALFAHRGRYYWELGAVDRERSILHSRSAADVSRIAENRSTWHEVTSRMIENARNLAAGRDGLAGLDVTPAYYHVLGVALRNGGRAAPEVDFGQWRETFEATLDRAVDEWYEKERDLPRVSRRDARMLKSWLLWSGALSDPATGGRLGWHPPRLTIPV